MRAAHHRAFAVLEHAQNGMDEGFIAAQSLAEVYAILTKFPPPFRHSHEQALLSIEENVFPYFKVSSLDGSDYNTLIREAALTGIPGGTIYDAVLLKSLSKVPVARIYTLNHRHFAAVAPSKLRAKLLEPW
jgi:predicted nucleic acid-binding protein